MDGRWLIGTFVGLWSLLAAMLAVQQDDFSQQFPFMITAVLFVAAGFLMGRKNRGERVWLAQAGLLWIPTFIGLLGFQLENLNRYRLLQQFPNCIADMQIAGCSSFAPMGQGTFAIGWLASVLVTLPGILWLMRVMAGILRREKEIWLHAGIASVLMTWPLAGYLWWMGNYGAIMAMVIWIAVFPMMWAGLGVVLWGMRKVVWSSWTSVL